jgi:DNA-binding FadR family transcriptional regulator
VSDDLAVALAEPIVRGDTAAGESLPSESDISESFGVSRPVAREAVQILALAGVLLVQHGKRTTVRPEREWNVLSPTVQLAFERVGRGEDLRRQLYEVRLVLEVACAGHAAQRAAIGDRERINQMAVDTQRIAQEGGGMRAFLDIDREFHGTIASVCGNLALGQLAREVQGYLASSWEASLLTESEMIESALQHISVAEAILAGDSDLAQRAMSDHIRWAATIERASDESSGALT